MTSILRSYGLPTELVYVVLVESRFKNRSLSHKGAAGQWQLMPATARALGLRVDEWVDERRDPVKSTHAAARYLRKLFKRFQSWPLALAAYNGGQTALNKTLQRTGAEDFWELCRRKALPEEVRAYVPKVYAAIVISQQLEAYGFERPRHLPVYAYDSVRIWNPLRLEQVARWTEVPLKRLRSLNPSLSRDRLPPQKESFLLNLPELARESFDIAYQNYLRDMNRKTDERSYYIFDQDRLLEDSPW
jgi:membrane-bound lytic murein transglycosylase D